MLYFFLIKKKFCITLGRFSCSQSTNFVEYISIYTLIRILSIILFLTQTRVLRYSIKPSRRVLVADR